MPLVDITVEMGMLTFASGSQKKGVVFDYEISDASEKEYEKYVTGNGFPVTRAVTMKAGDATWHYGHTIHSAPGNYSGTRREIMTVIYLADGARITEPKHKYQQNDHKTWLMGYPVGGPVASELNPLVI